MADIYGNEELTIDDGHSKERGYYRGTDSEGRILIRYSKDEKHQYDKFHPKPQLGRVRPTDVRMPESYRR